MYIYKLEGSAHLRPARARARLKPQEAEQPMIRCTRTHKLIGEIRYVDVYKSDIYTHIYGTATACPGFRFLFYEQEISNASRQLIPTHGEIKRGSEILLPKRSEMKKIGHVESSKESNPLKLIEH
jgi:hypothetical protein